jgi:hypothetical protein
MKGNSFFYELFRLSQFTNPCFYCFAGDKIALENTFLIKQTDSMGRRGP